MIAFEVSVNGKLVCTAGVGDFGVLSAILSLVRRSPELVPNPSEVEELTFEVGGLESTGVQVREHLRWLAARLEVGDVVSIRVVERPEVDAPQERRREDPESAAKAKRRYYEQLKREFGE